MNESQLDPAYVPALNDPGDETQRNFRYQHACGVILLVAGACGKPPYTAIWCEHHEDLLAERQNGQYDAYQVKTRRPGLGDWTLADEDILNSIKRFIALHDLFEHKINKFILLSNAEFMKCGLHIKDQAKVKRSLVLLLEAIEQAETEEAIYAPFDEVLTALANKLECSVGKLFLTLKKVTYKNGPPRESFESVLAHEQLTKLEKCSTMSPASLNTIRDELMHKVYQASSLHNDNPDQYFYGIEIEDKLSPIQKAKRLSINIVHECIENSRELVFRYQPIDTSLSPTSLRRYPTSTILEKKFERGNLVDQIQTMKRRTLSAESHLLGLSALNPEKASELINQLEAVVQAECDEAALETKVELKDVNAPSYGPNMLNRIHNRLRNLADNDPKLVQHQRYETLVGLVGLLTENCSVWWSNKFDVKGAA